MPNIEALDNADWSTLDDNILVKAHLKGDERAFQVLFKKYRTMVSRLVFSIVKEETHVEDIVQEVFLLAYRNLPKFRGQSALKTWIYRITVNEALRSLNRSRRWVPLSGKENEPGAVPSTIVFFNQGDSPERVLIEGEQKILIQEALGSLKAPHRVILILFYLEDMDVKEIARILDIPEGSVKSRLFYARESLKKTLQPLLGKIHTNTGETHVM